MINEVFVSNKIEKIKWNKIPSHRVNSVTIKFNFSQEWKDLVCVALFIQDGKCIPQVIDENDECLLPVELKMGTAQLSVFGNKTDGSAYRETAIKMEFDIFDSGYCEDMTPPVPPTPDLYEQLLKRFADMVTVDVDQIYNAISENAQSGIAVAQAVAGGVETANEYTDKQIANIPKPVLDHNELINRDAPDQHTIGSITGLKEELDKGVKIYSGTDLEWDNRLPLGSTIKILSTQIPYKFKVGDFYYNTRQMLLLRMREKIKIDSFRYEYEFERVSIEQDIVDYIKQINENSVKIYSGTDLGWDESYAFGYTALRSFGTASRPYIPDWFGEIKVGDIYYNIDEAKLYKIVHLQIGINPNSGKLTGEVWYQREDSIEDAVIDYVAQEIAKIPQGDVNKPIHTTLNVEIEDDGFGGYRADYNDNDINNHRNAGGIVQAKYYNQAENQTYTYYYSTMESDRKPTFIRTFIDADGKTEQVLASVGNDKKVTVERRIANSVSREYVDGIKNNLDDEINLLTGEVSDVKQDIGNIQTEQTLQNKAIQKNVDDIIAERNYANSSFANAIKNTVNGETIAVDDVSSVEHKVEVKTSSKNLFNSLVSDFYYCNQIISGNDITISAEGDNAHYKYQIKTKIGHSYTVSISNFEKIAGADTTGIFLSSNYYSMESADIGVLDNTKKVLTFTATTRDLYFHGYVTHAYKQGAEIKISNIQVEENTVATPYTPHLSQADMAFSNILVCKDEADLPNAVSYPIGRYLSVAVNSIAPTMYIKADKAGMLLDAEYNVETKKASEKIVNSKIDSLSIPATPDMTQPIGKNAEGKLVTKAGGGSQGTYELIETITMPEDAILNKKTEPDGTPYNFKDVIIKIHLGTGTGDGTWGVADKWGRSLGSMYFSNVNYANRYAWLKVYQEKGRYFFVHTDFVQNYQDGSLHGNNDINMMLYGVTYPIAEIFSSGALSKGTTLEVWAVRL